MKVCTTCLCNLLEPSRPAKAWSHICHFHLQWKAAVYIQFHGSVDRHLSPSSRWATQIAESLGIPYSGTLSLSRRSNKTKTTFYKATLKFCAVIPLSELARDPTQS